MGRTAPSHARLSLWLSEQIELGVFAPGDRLPSEHDLAERHAVSRTTVRRALQTLETAGRIHRRQGSGTYVSSTPLQQALSDLRSFTTVISDLGRAPGLREVAITADLHPPDDARSFLSGDPLWLARRVRLADGDVFSVSYSWLPDDVGRDLTAATIERRLSLYRVLEEDFGVVISEAREAIRAEPASIEDAARLGVEPRSPIIAIYRWSRDRAGTPVEFARSVSPGDRHEYVVTLRRP